MIMNVALEEFGQTVNASNSIMIRDTEHDQTGVIDFGIPFVVA